MDEVGALGLDDLREPPDVEHHGERVVARRGKRHVQRPDRLRLARELARIGDDQGPRAGLDQRLGDRHRRAPVGGRGRGRRDLHDRSARKRRVESSSEGGKRPCVHARLRWRTRSR